MSRENTKRGITIVGHLAEAAAVEGAMITHDELSTLLTQFNHHTSEDDEYRRPGALVEASIKEYREADNEQTAKNIEASFIKVNKDVDQTLFS